MERFENLNYYELLEVPVNATSFEIRQAYRHALSIYEENSLISDSFFTDRERGAILRRIEEAFSTLIDTHERVRYNRRLMGAGVIDAASIEKSNKRKDGPIPLFSLRKKGGQPPLSKRIRNRVDNQDMTAVSRDILSRDVISGSDLKRLRKHVGIGVEEIFEVTRISVKVLTAIENDDLESLPQAFYLKNFLKAYAKVFKLDAERLISGYLANLARSKI